MSWNLSATGHIEAGLEHLEAELHDALHKVLSDPRFGLVVSHFHGAAVDRMHTVGQASGGEPEAAPAAEAASDAPSPEVAAPAGKPAKGG